MGKIQLGEGILEQHAPSDVTAQRSGLSDTEESSSEGKNDHVMGMILFFWSQFLKDDLHTHCIWRVPLPIASMYGTFTIKMYKNQPNVG